MKKYLLLLTSAALLLAGCAKELVSNGVSSRDGELTKVTFTASLDNGVATKAVADGDGAAASVNRCIMEIYYGGELFAREYAPVDQKKATFTAQVVSNRTYTVAFWADKVDATTEAGLKVDKYYTTNATGGLQAITIKGDYVGNDDARDAFAHCGTYTVAQVGSSWGNIKLKRPFAQINVITTDVATVAEVSSLKPEKVNLVLKNAVKTYNVLDSTAVAGSTGDLTYTANIYKWDADTTECTLSMDYIFAEKEKGAIDINWKAQKTGDADVEHAFAAVPYQRNYRTNIKGKLLTTTGQWTVTVDSDWDGDGTTVEGGDDPYLVNYFAAGSIAAANEALKTNNAVSIDNPTDLGTDIIIPEEQNGESVYVKVTGAASGGIKVQKNDTDNGPASLAIESDSKTLNIDLPNSHVDVNKGANYTQITALTGDNTLVIGKDVVAAALDVKKGSVEIHGKVDSLTRAAGISAKFYASDSTTLANYVTWAKAGETVELECDIDLAGTTWNSPELNADFNGNGHIIKNIQNLNCAPDYAGLFNVSYSNIKNVTIQDAEFEYGTETMSARGGILVGDMRRGSIENCHVVGAKFTGYQKVGGLVGFISANDDNYTDISIKNCSVTNATFAACGANDGTDDDDYLYQAGGLVGYIALGNRNISISNCSVKNIIYDNSKYKGVYDKLNTNDGYLSHTFVGAIFSQTNNAANTLAFTANTISGTNTQLKANMYGSAYFGWARNPEYKPSETVTLGKITIDGQEWTPNYPYQIAETGAKYSTLANALTAATAGQTVQILKAGDYTFPGNTKKAITVEGLDEKDADGNYVVAINLNGVSEYNENLTFKHLTFNFTNSEGPDRGFTHCVNMTYNECAFTGLMWGYDSQVSTFNDCLFHQATKYNVWSYGGNLEFNRCTFESNGNFVNVYATNACGNISEVKAVDCKFVNKNSSAKKAAFNIKGKVGTYVQHTHVVIENCTTEGLFPNSSESTESTIYSDEGLWMFDDGPWEDAVYAKVDGVTYYPYFTIDANGNYSVKNATGLKMAIKHWNALTSKGEKTITMADGTYEVSDIPIIQAKEKSLVVKAANAKKAVLTPDAGTKTNMIFLISGGGLSTTGDEWVTFEGLKFNMPNDPGKITSAVFCTTQNDATYSPLVGESMTRYAHNITVRNCELQGCGSEYSSLLKAAQGAGANIALVDNCVVNHSGYVVSDYFSNVRIVNTKVTDTKACANIANVGITVEGCNISTYHDYCIRTNGGAVVVKDNTFTMTYDGVATDAGIVVLRGTGDQASISGNTVTKAVNTMWDCYCKTAWTVNGEAKAAGTGINF